MQTDVKLADFESILKEVPERLPVIVDGTSNLEIFFKYKGQVIDIADLSLKKSKGTITDEQLDKEIRQRLKSCLFSGEYVALFLGGEIDFNLIKFLSNFKWFEKSSFFKLKNLLSKDYLVKHEILKKDEDKDVLGNKGFWQPNEKTRLCVIFTTTYKFMSEIKVNFSNDYFEFFLVKD